MTKLIKGSSDRNWDDLVESLQSENTILDFERLRNELEVDEDPEFYPKPGSPEQEDHERLLKHQFDILNHHSHHQATSQHPPSSSSANHHVAGEKLDQHHHLARGPHGALVITDDEDDDVARINHGHEIKEKINIHPHELKPNHAGAILTYDNHHSEHQGGIGGGASHHHHHQHHGGGLRDDSREQSN